MRSLQYCFLQWYFIYWTRYGRCCHVLSTLGCPGFQRFVCSVNKKLRLCCRSVIIHKCLVPLCGNTQCIHTLLHVSRLHGIPGRSTALSMIQKVIQENTGQTCGIIIRPIVFRRLWQRRSMGFYLLPCGYQFGTTESRHDILTEFSGKNTQLLYESLNRFIDIAVFES